MFTRIFKPQINIGVYASVAYMEKDSCPIDQTPVQDFNIDPATGRPVSDISKILRAQTQYEKDELYKNLIERTVSDTDMTDDEIRHQIAYGRPRLAQSPSELADYAESMTKRILDDKENARKKELDSMKREMEDEILKEHKDAKKSKLQKVESKVD